MCVIPAKAGIQSPVIPAPCPSVASSEGGKAGIQEMFMNCCVYILASSRNGTLYIGVTSNLSKRIYEHKSGAAEGFTKKYHVHTLVWYECTESIEVAITREKQLKAWKRGWKLELIEKENLTWRDLYEEL